MEFALFACDRDDRKDDWELEQSATQRKKSCGAARCGCNERVMTIVD